MNQNSIKIHFILEGYEENMLFQLIEEEKNDNKIEMTYRNCKGGGVIPAFFQSALASDNYDYIFCVYDVDYKVNEQKSMYNNIRNGLYKVLGDETDVDKVSLCTNPNTLLIILLGYDTIDKFVNIESDKKSNTKLISKYCNKIGNKKDYDASEWQLNLIKEDYLFNEKASFDRIINNINILDINYKSNTIGSNLIPIIKALIEDDINFFLKYITDN